MDKTAFQARIISTFHNLKYVFDEDIEEGKSIQRMSTGQKVLFTGGAFIAGGLVAALCTKFPKSSDEEIHTEIQKLKKTCDLVGIRLDTGSIVLSLFIFSDDLSQDQMIGRSVLIQDQMKAFKNFTMRFMLTRMAVYANVFYIFSDSEKAFQFRQSCQANCKHGEFFKKIDVMPWGVDVSAKSVWGYKGLPVSMFNSKDLETKLFS
jgi:hypothetical protein